MPEDNKHGVGEAAALRQQRLAKYRPRTAKKVAAGISLALAVLMLVPTGQGALAEATTTQQIVAGLCYFGMFALPAVYWLYCNRRDTATVRQWAVSTQEYVDIWKSLDPTTKAAFATPRTELPLLPKRRWWVINVLMLMLMFLGGAVLPDLT